MWGLRGVLRRRQGIKCHPFFASVDWDALLKKKVAVPYVPHLAGPSDYTYFDRTRTPSSELDTRYVGFEYSCD